MSKKNIYSASSIFPLLGIFISIFWLMYYISINFHKSRKIQSEIEIIENQNNRLRKQIEDKKLELLYLQSEERIEKEAKIQLNKKRPNEYVLFFSESFVETVPEDIQSSIPAKNLQDSLPIWKKWQLIFFSPNNTNHDNE